MYQRQYLTILLLLALILPVGCRTAQKGHLSHAVEMLNKCQFEQAVTSAQEARSIGDPKSEFALTSLLVEAKARELMSMEATAAMLYQSYVDQVPSVPDVDAAKSIASSFDELVADCTTQ